MSHLTQVHIFQLFHILCVIYWLGADMGVFYSSGFVIDAKRSTESRMVAKQIMFALDLAPRICMPLMLPTGVQLGYNIGFIKIPVALLAGVWIVSLLWLALVLFLFKSSGKRNLVFLTKTDFHFRWVAAIAFIAYAVYALLSETRIMPDYIAYKLIIFAGTVACGVMIRLKLRKFGPAWAKLVKGEETDADNRALYLSLAEGKPYVLAIWLAILVEIALGIKLI